MHHSDKKFHDTVNQWQMLSALSGVNLNQLWDSDDDQAHEVFEAMERIEEFNRMVQESEIPYKVAQQAITMGIDSNELYRYHQSIIDAREQLELERLRLEERNNKRINDLVNIHGFAFHNGRSQHQKYWKFTADLGQGPTLYKCRLVHVSWWTDRIWREWKDAQGVKHVDKVIVTSGSPYQMDNEWPEAWRNQYNRRFTSDQLPYAYTQKLLTDYANTLIIKPKRKRTRKATV